MMLTNSLTDTVDPATREVTRWVGFAVFFLAWITFLSRNDPGSPALRAVMSGNLVFHALGVVIDSYGYATGAMTTSGLVTGVIPHALLGIGFGYYLIRRRTSLAATPASGTPPRGTRRPSSTVSATDLTRWSCWSGQARSSQKRA